MSVKHFVGLDCGNSSFRTILASYDGKKITTEVIEQIPNEMIQIGDLFYWDIIKIFEGFKNSLKKIVKREIKIDSVGVCTWGIDFALFEKQGVMMSNPLAYRNTQGKEYLDRLDEVQKKNTFDLTGIFPDKINSVYLLQSIRDKFEGIYNNTDKILMVPDILNYFLTGVMINEPSELSTSQLLNSSTKTIDKDACAFFGINDQIFCEIGKHGRIIGNIENHILRELDVNYDIPVICVPSHDTASAVLAIPATEEFVFISSGTWALIGTELDKPIISNAVYEAALTNEVGAFDKITLLKNNAGMFIIQRIKKEYDWKNNAESEWSEITDLAENNLGEVVLFDVNAERFFNPVSMSDEIWSFLKETKQVEGTKDWSKIIKSTYYSMACSYAIVIEKLEKIVSKEYSSIYIVGGGSKNIMLNNLTSKITGKIVVACSKESTALGNIAAQIKAYDTNISIEEIRAIIHESYPLERYASDYDENILKRYMEIV